MLCTLQLQPLLLMPSSAPTTSTMASQPSTSTATSTTAKQDPMPPQQSTAPGKMKSDVKPTSSTPNPVPTSVVQKYVTDAAEIISSSPTTRKMFLAEVFKKCNEVAKWEEETGKRSPDFPKRSPSPSRKLSLFVSYPNYSDGKFIPPGKNKVLDRLIDKYSRPKTSTSTSGSTSTVTASSATGEPSTTNTTADPAEASTSQNDKSKPASTSEEPGYNKSSSVLRRRIEEGHPNQALTLFAPLGMAEDLTKIQFTLCNEIKAELQAVHKAVAAISFEAMKNEIAEASNVMEERMSSLEDKYSELKEIILHRTAQHFTIDPSLLEKWNPTTMALKHSPWTNMRLVLNKVAADNIIYLFPTDWHPKPPLSNVQEKHFKVLTEIMTEMFLQCGLLIEADIIEMDYYQDFLKALHHHIIYG